MTTIAYHQYTNIPYMGSYASAPIIGPLSTNRTPNTNFHSELGVLSGIHPNPPQFYPSDGASTFAQGRAQYRRTNTTQFNFGRGTQMYSSIPESKSTKYISPASSSMYMAAKKCAAIGKSSLKCGLPNNSQLSYKCYIKNDVKSAIRTARSGGCSAPAKKGSIFR